VLCCVVLCCVATEPKRSYIETSVYYVHLTRLIAREDFISHVCRLKKNISSSIFSNLYKLMFMFINNLLPCIKSRIFFDMLNDNQESFVLPAPQNRTVQSMARIVLTRQ
jgi:hypothetical protein